MSWHLQSIWTDNISKLQCYPDPTPRLAIQTRSRFRLNHPLSSFTHYLPLHSRNSLESSLVGP